MKNIGKTYESIAADYLIHHNATIIEQNYAFSGGEIDIIAQEDQDLLFIEVKGRKTANYGIPGEYVDHRKQQKLIKTAMHYLQAHQLTDNPCRFDVISILQPTSKTTTIEWIKNAFTL